MLITHITYYSSHPKFLTKNVNKIAWAEPNLAHPFGSKNFAKAKRKRCLAIQIVQTAFSFIYYIFLKWRRILAFGIGIPLFFVEKVRKTMPQSNIQTEHHTPAEIDRVPECWPQQDHEQQKAQARIIIVRVLLKYSALFVCVFIFTHSTHTCSSASHEDKQVTDDDDDVVVHSNFLPKKSHTFQIPIVFPCCRCRYSASKRSMYIFTYYHTE